MVRKTTEDRKVFFDFRLSDPATGLSSSVYKDYAVFNSAKFYWGTMGLMKINLLESLYVRNDRLMIKCDMTVILGVVVSKSETICDIYVTPSDMLNSIGSLPDWEEGADVNFKVKGEIFYAHKIVLAMWSPVFKAELYGPMGVNEAKTITIEDMEPAVFKGLLHFIYKDLLPTMNYLYGNEKEEMVKHFLVAAGRYAMERMKVICEIILAKKLDVDNVAATFALADQHHCCQLKDACIRFINSLNRVDDVVSSEGHGHLKRACPSVIVEIWGKSAKARKISKNGKEVTRSTSTRKRLG
jgi:speckle-type POZ protein